MQRIENLSADLPYLLYLPDDLDNQDSWQLIVFLHGRGERGTDLQLVNKWGVPKYVDAGNNLNAIVYAPQCPETIENWVPKVPLVLDGINKIEADYSISKTHITGFSMGGHGTHYLAVHHPERFASVAPVATYMYPSDDVTSQVCVLKDKPFWIFHSVGDFVPVAMSDSVVETLKNCDAQHLKYTRLTDEDHTQTADYAYLKKDFYEWMLT